MPCSAVIAVPPRQSSFTDLDSFTKPPLQFPAYNEVKVAATVVQVAECGNMEDFIDGELRTTLFEARNIPGREAGLFANKKDAYVVFHVSGTGTTKESTAKNGLI